MANGSRISYDIAEQSDADEGLDRPF